MTAHLSIGRPRSWLRLWDRITGARPPLACCSRCGEVLGPAGTGRPQPWRRGETRRAECFGTFDWGNGPSLLRPPRAREALRVTVVPTTQTEHMLLEERDAAIARAERAEAAAERAQADLVALAGELGEAVRRIGDLRRERESEQTLREAAENRCRSLGATLDRAEIDLTRARATNSQLELEVVETSMVAESIITAPSTPDAKLESALLEALDIAERRRDVGRIPNGDGARLRELRRLVPS